MRLVCSHGRGCGHCVVVVACAVGVVVIGVVVIGVLVWLLVVRVVHWSAVRVRTVWVVRCGAIASCWG